MNLTAFLNRGIKRTGGTEADKAAEAARQQWLNKLMADETRAWWNVGEADASAIRGLLVLLTLVGLAHAHDKRAETPATRVMRGACSALEQSIKSGNVITVDTARAISSACHHAREVLQSVSVRGIQHAAVYMDKVTR